jgi:hypothetical protein
MKAAGVCLSLSLSTSARDLTGRVGVPQFAASSIEKRLRNTVVARFSQRLGYDLTSDELTELTTDADFHSLATRWENASVSSSPPTLSLD